jgi:hypothetical protein
MIQEERDLLVVSSAALVAVGLILTGIYIHRWWTRR